MTGYLTKAGIDLSFIFVSGNSGIVSGYLLSDGRDIGNIFAPYSINASLETGLKLSSGADINTLFEAIPPIPLQLSGCCLWLDATDASTLTLQSGNKVSEWRDKSASAFSFVQATSAKQPTYTLNSQNSLPTLLFNSANLTYLEGTANFAFGTNSYSLFCVYNSSVGTDMGPFNKSYTATPTGSIALLHNAGQFRYTFTHTGGSRIANVSAGSLLGPKIAGLVVNRSPANLDSSYKTGTLLGTLTINDATNYAPTAYPMLVGAYGASSAGSAPYSFFPGNICEIISYSKSENLTDANRQKIEGYLAWKWGLQAQLPVGHIYINSPP